MARNINELKNKLKLMKETKTWSLKSMVLDFLDKNNIVYILDYNCYDMTFDIYLKEYNVSIDLCYVDIHNEQHLSLFYDTHTIKNMMYKKAIKCKNLKIHHMFIWDYMWSNITKRAVIQNLILNCCNMSKTKIYARNTYIKVERAFDVREFFHKNNMQGYRTAKHAISLYDKVTNEMIMSYAIGHAYFGKGKYDLEIARGACKLGYYVIGGPSKLWKFITTEYAPNKSIVYYVDLNYYSGRSLDMLCKQFNDMKYITSKNSFKNWFVEEQVMHNRDPKHHKEIQQLVNEGLVKTCYDAGSLVYVYKISNIQNNLR